MSTTCSSVENGNPIYWDDKVAQEIIGKADAEATTIYAKAYNQSQESREFYGFLKTMETYKASLSEKDWLVLSTKSDFFKFFQSQTGK